MASRQFITFWLDDDLFGIDILLTQEIIQQTDITPVDHVPNYIQGLINLRGQVVTVFDLHSSLNLGGRESKPKNNCIILKNTGSTQGQDPKDTNNDIIGLLVDRVGDIITIEDTEVESTPSDTQGINERFINGIIKLDNELLIILNTQEILITEEAIL